MIADISNTASEIVLIVHRIGGAHSKMRRQLVLIASNDLTAGLLNRNGLKTGNRNRWSRERVTAMWWHHRIPMFKAAEDGVEPWLNLGHAAKLP